MEDTGIITIDGVEYNHDDLSDVAKFIIKQILSLNDEISLIKNKAHYFEKAIEGYNNDLKNELSVTNEEEQ